MKRDFYVVLIFITLIFSFIALTKISQQDKFANDRYNLNSNPTNNYNYQASRRSRDILSPTPISTLQPVISRDGKRITTPNIERRYNFKLTMNTNNNWELSDYWFPSNEKGTAANQYYLSITNSENTEYIIKYRAVDTGFSHCVFDENAIEDNWDYYYEMVSEIDNDIGLLRLGRDLDTNMLMTCQFQEEKDQWDNVTNIGFITINYPEVHDRDTLIEAIDIVRNTEVEYY